MKYEIKLENSFWTCNGRKSEDWDHNEKDFMDRFFRENKLKDDKIAPAPNANPLVKRVHHNDKKLQS